jgi:rare lipoprotein A
MMRTVTSGILILLLFIGIGCAQTRPVTRASLNRIYMNAPPPVLGTVPATETRPRIQNPETPVASAARHRTRSLFQVGLASFYHGMFQGRTTASGETYDEECLTAAHQTLDFGTRLRVTNLENKRSVVVTVNDRGPFVRGRVIDLSRRAARALGFIEDGTTRVRIDRLSRGGRAT